jgi:hypothetical protein
MITKKTIALLLSTLAIASADELLFQPTRWRRPYLVDLLVWKL